MNPELPHARAEPNPVFNRAFRRLYGQPCWGVTYERDVSLSMNFGKPSLHVREPFRSSSGSEEVRHLAARRRVWVRGQWRLLICGCHWRLSQYGQLLTTGASSLHRIEQAIAELDGQQLTEVRIDRANGDTCFVFDLGCVLDCRRLEKEGAADLWMLYEPKGYVLTVAGDGRPSRRHASES